MKPLTLEETGIKTDDNEMCIKGIDELPIFSWNTKTKEFYVLGHKFDGINSIEDFINYIHNLDKENKSLQSQLKSKEEENQELKKQLEENKNPLKGIFAQVNDDILLRNCGVMQSEINELKNQQKEFINYLENMLDDENDIFSVVRVKDVLQKYKSIIGDDK